MTDHQAKQDVFQSMTLCGSPCHLVLVGASIVLIQVMMQNSIGTGCCRTTRLISGTYGIPNTSHVELVSGCQRLHLIHDNRIQHQWTIPE
jgi:hypothetical protein